MKPILKIPNYALREYMRQAQETAEVTIALQRGGKKYKGRSIPKGGFSSDYRFDLALKGCFIESDSAIQAVLVGQGNSGKACIPCLHNIPVTGAFSPGRPLRPGFSRKEPIAL